jgi:hypothetical protein
VNGYLRSLLLFVTATCLWLGHRLSAINGEESAVGAIRRANGWVEYGPPRGFHGVISFGACERRPKWRRILIGNGPYDTVGVVHLSDGYDYRVDCDDALLAELLPQLKRLNDLKYVNLDGSQRVTSASAGLLAQLSSLKVLNLCNTSVDDVAVDSLARLRHLEHLDVLGTQISEAGVARLRCALPD